MPWKLAAKGQKTPEFAVYQPANITNQDEEGCETGDRGIKMLARQH